MFHLVSQVNNTFQYLQWVYRRIERPLNELKQMKETPGFNENPVLQAEYQQKKQIFMEQYHLEVTYYQQGIVSLVHLQRLMVSIPWDTIGFRGSIERRRVSSGQVLQGVRKRESSPLPNRIQRGCSCCGKPGKCINTCGRDSSHVCLRRIGTCLRLQGSDELYTERMIINECERLNDR